MLRDAGHSTGLISLAGSGQPLLGNRWLPAAIERRPRAVDPTISNLLSTGPPGLRIQIGFDIEWFVASTLRIDEMDTSDGSRPDNYCSLSVSCNLILC